MRQQCSRVLMTFMIVLVLAACSAPTLTSTTPPLSEGEIATPPIAPTAEPPATAAPVEPPPAVEYNLGEATIVQEQFPEDSRFRNMPVRLNGLIAAPSDEGGPFPVVAILHGTHPGCPVDEQEVDRWPCAPEVEQPNYRGFEYLVRGLAEQGYVALSININAENTFGFGEPVSGERLQQLLDLHLRALAEASTGGDNDFGVELEGRADLERLAFVGHSRGGDAILGLARHLQNEVEAADERGFGPVGGLLMVAPAAASVDPVGGSPAPMAIILPACDGDVIHQDGQVFYEAARLAPQQTEWATSVWLEGANHNAFNQILPGDFIGLRGRPDCETLLDPDVQRAFLVDYAADFMTSIWGRNSEAVRRASERLGLDVQAPAPDELYGLPARVATLPAAADRRTLLVPARKEELAAHRLGGPVMEEGVTTHFCPEGYYTPTVVPGSEPCRRVNLTIPGHPALAVVSWAEPGAAWQFALPEGQRDISGFSTLSLRAAVDPMSPLNASSKSQAFRIQLTDGVGKSAMVATGPDEPALRVPLGTVDDDVVFEDGLFTGRVPLTAIRLPLAGFEGVDLTDIREIALVFDQRDSGSLFVADLEVVRPGSS